MDTLYFHSPCFDGIVSAVLALDLLESRDGWKVEQLVSVNYHMKSEWLQTELAGRAAVVDFLYHPQAEFWVDHHSTAFLARDAYESYVSRRGSRVIYDPRAKSAAALLWREFRSDLDPSHEPLVRAATKTDAAEYESVREAVEGDSPELRINSSLTFGDGGDYSAGLVRDLRLRPLPQVAERSDVVERFERFRALSRVGLARVGTSIESPDENGVTVVRVDGRDVIVPRYAPFHYHPEARYSATLVTTGSDRAKITVMRNPWQDFESVELGELCRAYGGGGHQRVGSIVLRDTAAKRAEDVLRGLLVGIREAEHASA